MEASVLRSLSESLTSITPGVPSTIDTFYRAKLALEGFFDSFLAVPTEFWTAMPVFNMLHNLWAITMLARWAKVMGPGRSRTPHATTDILTPRKVIWDPSAQRPLPEKAVFGAGIAPAPSFGPASTQASTGTGPAATRDNKGGHHHHHRRGPSSRGRLADIPPAILDPAQISAADPTIPRLVAALKNGLHAAGALLNLDIVGILSTLARRCDEVHQQLLLAQKSSAEGGGGGACKWQNVDVWYLSGKKVLIARAKLEKWAEILAAGGVVAGTGAAAGPGRTGEHNNSNKLRPQSQQLDQGVGDGDVRMGNTPGPVVDEEKEAQPAVIAAGATSPPPAHQAQQQQQYCSEEEAMAAAFQREMDAAAQGILPPEVLHDADMYAGGLGGVWMDSMFDPLDPSLWLNDAAAAEWGMALFGPSQQEVIEMQTGGVC